MKTQALTGITALTTGLLAGILLFRHDMPHPHPHLYSSLHWKRYSPSKNCTW